MSTDIGSNPSPVANSNPTAAGDRASRGLPPLARWWEGGFSALVLTGSLAPVLGQVVAVLAYPLLPTRAGSSPAVPQSLPAALIIALAVTIIVWALEFFLMAPMMSSPKAQPRFYTELIYRYQQVCDRWTHVGLKKVPVEVQTQLDWAHRALIGEDSGPSLRWALAYGYVSVLRAIHFAEEALILVELPERVLSDALYDELALGGSTIATRDALAKQIESARSGVATLAPVGDHQAREKIQETNREAREKLRVVRYAIDAFRDDARDGVVRARNQLLLAMFVVSALTFLLLGLAEASGVSVVALTTVAALYLVGAVVGCFNRLRIEAKQSSAEEDFGLFQARLLAMVLMSGLAAIGGVYLVAALPALVPIQGATRPVPELATIFDLSSNSSCLLYAAIFGLVPENLTKLLFGTADKLQADLLTSGPANSTAS